MPTPQQAQIIDQFSSETFVQNRMDVQHTPIYDTVTFTAGAGSNPTINSNTSQFFTNVGANSGKNYSQTNMTTSQQLPAPQSFSIMAFRLRWSEDVLYTDLINVLNGFALEFYLGQDKPYQRAPLWYFTAGGGISGYSTQTNQAALVNGMPTKEAIRTLAIPIVIENKMNFYAQLSGNPLTLTTVASNALATGIRLTLLLDGLYARGVQ